MKKVIQNKFVAGCIVISIGSLLIYFIAWISGQYNVYFRELNHWSVGKVVSRTNSGSSVEVEYYVDSVRYIKKLVTTDIDLYLGEYLKVEYDYNDPGYAIVAPEKNFFLETENTMTVVGTVRHTEETYSRGSKTLKVCTVKYPYRNRTIIAREAIPIEWELQKRDSVFVEYKIDNPKICIIKLEE